MMRVSSRQFWLVALAAFAVSLAGSVAVELWLHERIPLWGPYIGLQPSLNTGVAFGLDFGWLEPILIGIALVLVGWMALSRTHPPLLRVAFGLILGGGVANIVDRLHDGAVTDMFQVGSFPIFNVADSCITVGVVLLFLETWLGNKQSRQ